jgi:hypothetical protein
MSATGRAGHRYDRFDDGRKGEHGITFWNLTYGSESGARNEVGRRRGTHQFWGSGLSRDSHDGVVDCVNERNRQGGVIEIKADGRYSPVGVMGLDSQRRVGMALDVPGGRHAMGWLAERPWLSA